MKYILLILILIKFYTVAIAFILLSIAWEWASWAMKRQEDKEKAAFKKH